MTATKRSVAALVAVCMLVATGCAGKVAPQATPQISGLAQAVTYARQAIAGADGVLTVVDQLMTMNPPAIPKAEGLVVVQGIALMGRELNRAAKALDIVRTAAAGIERQNAMGVAVASIQAAQQMVLQAVVPINNKAARQQVVAALQVVQVALAAMQLALDVGLVPGAGLDEAAAGLAGTADQVRDWAEFHGVAA